MRVEAEIDSGLDSLLIASPTTLGHCAAICANGSVGAISAAKRLIAPEIFRSLPRLTPP